MSIADPYLDFMKTYTLLDPIKDLGTAWDMVPTSTIQASFNRLLDSGKLKECLRDNRGSLDSNTCTNSQDRG